MYSGSLSSSKSAFSDKNLSTLESLVLEVALEDAHQQMQLSQNNFNNGSNDNNNGNGNNGVRDISGGSGTLTPKDCEMSATDYESIIKLPGNELCADCPSHDTEWASVTFGILLCAQCSGVHRALGTHISRVRSIKMDNWSKDHLDRMRVGGNRKCQRYLECHNLPIETDIPIKYSSEPAEKYKQVIQERVEKRRQKALVDGSNKSNMTDESMGSFALEDHSTHTNSNNNNPKRSSENSNGSGAIMEDDSQQQQEQHQQSSTLDSWFNMSTKRRPPSLRGSSAHGNSFGASSHHSASAAAQRMNYRRSHSSNSTPTIVYMGKSFSADGSDAPHLAEDVQQGKARMRSQSDIKLLAELSLQQEEIARANLTTNHWRHSAPINFWTSDKKVEPFDADSYYGGGRRNYPFSSNNSNNNSDDAARRRARQQESMRQKLAYSDADVLKIAQDDQEFARLKAGLKHKGAVTNEVLKQKLYAFVAKSKLRVAANGGENNNKRSSNSPKAASSSSADDMLGGPRSKTIHTSTAQRL